MTLQLVRQYANTGGQPAPTAPEDRPAHFPQDGTLARRSQSLPTRSPTRLPCM